MKIVNISILKELVNKIGIQNVFKDLVARLELDYSNWNDFEKVPRHANYYPDGVIELMPTSTDINYAVKIVNGHPTNPAQGKLTVCALGLLYDTATGYPMLFSEMTLLTAIRTAATAAMAAKYLSKTNPKKLTILGCGAQSEFQVLAHIAILDLEIVHYFDRDQAAMDKFANNLRDCGVKLIAASSAEAALKDTDIVITATAAATAQQVLKLSDLKNGWHINAIGGDGPGKTELDPKILDAAKVVVEYFPQTKVEGEIQNMQREPDAELWEIIKNNKTVRTSDEQITVFDSVGFALEDYSTLMWLYSVCENHQIAENHDFVPEVSDPKNLFVSLL